MRRGDGSVRECSLLGLEFLQLGHEVKLIPVKRQKNDVADAGAICEAAVPDSRGTL